MSKPSHERSNARILKPIPPGEEIVISGIAGRFPESRNIRHLQENLMNKVDLITNDDRRWKFAHPDLPRDTGKVPNLEKFDAEFFGINYKEAHTMDTMSRIVLEHSWEAIVDAGVNPKKLRGTRTGVFVGACFSETEDSWFYQNLQVGGLGIPGCNRAMITNRISHWLGVTGPSYAVDTACSSSLFALEHAYRAINAGSCDAAIVAGVNLCLNPNVSLQFSKLGVLSMDGRCKSFDESANGYCRSETIAALFLQKAKDAKRIYATVVHAKTNCDGFKEQGITFPSSLMQGSLLKEVYDETGLSPSSLGYVEAHGTGTQVGDPEEVNAIDRVFCSRRKEPLFIGSVKSNLGHSEPASGLCSVAKVIIAMETGLIPPNLHLKNVRKEIKAFAEGRLRPVTEPTPWNVSYSCINSFGFGGANAHLLLKPNPKEKRNGGLPDDELPRLVAVSGRTEDAVASFLNDIESRPADVEYVRLLNDVHSEHIDGHKYRGYTILPPRGLIVSRIREINNVAMTKRPVCFVFSGIGSQWPGMGESLLSLPVFAEAIKKCNEVLKPFEVDVTKIITSQDKGKFDSVLDSFVGIIAIQIGLVDVLRTVGIEPDKVIGHSIGELGCAYATGCLTLEQTILSAFSQNLAITKTQTPNSSMAIVGLHHEELKKICPNDIEIACHNSACSATICGPAESMNGFLAKLQANKILTKEIACGNIPYHSRYVAPARSNLFSYLEKVISNPKPRHHRWISSSVLQSKSSSTSVQLCSAEYYTNMLLNPVLFEEALALIPKDAIVIEVGPSDSLLSILKNYPSDTVTSIAVTRYNYYNSVEVLLQGLGKMYNAGLQPQIDKLYPHVSYPVSRSTPNISSSIKWDHSKDWHVTKYKLENSLKTGERQVKISHSEEEFDFVDGHIIDGRILYPATGYLDLIWETLARMNGVSHDQQSVIFEDVKFLRATNVSKEGTIVMTLMIQKGSGRFEVIESDAAVVTGFIHSISNPDNEKVDPALIITNKDEKEEMTSRDFYKELRLRGYYYSGLFRSVKSSTITGLKGRISWHGNWVAFMDNMLQMQILGSDTRGLFVPTGITKLVIDPLSHLNQVRKMVNEEKEFPVYVNKTLGTISSGGIEIRGLKASAIPRRKPAGDPVLEEYKFVPNTDRIETSLLEITRLSIHIVLENQMGIRVKTVELIEEQDKVPVTELLSPLLAEALGDVPLIQAEVGVVGNNVSYGGSDFPSTVSMSDTKKVNKETNASLCVGHNLLTPDRAENLRLLMQATKEAGFILTREDAAQKENIEKYSQAKNLNVILEKVSGKHLFVLLRKKEKMPKKILVIKVSNDKFDWVDEMRNKMTEVLEKENPGTVRVIYVSEGDFENGLVGFINCLRREAGGEIVRGILIQDSKAPKFSLDNPFYAKELQKDLAMIVLGANGTWGSYRHLPLPPLVPKPTRHAWANQIVRGDLSSLSWIQGPIQVGFEDSNLVNVVYSSINFRDVMLATGKLAVEVVAKTRLMQECVLGFEYCGVTSKGQRVMGLVDSRAMTNLCSSDPDLLWEVPNDWSLEDAATVPCVYGTCYYALYTSGKMKKGDKVLIHAGSGGVGQAAIQLALFEGCEVFTTVGTQEKRNFIREHFPQIRQDHIGNSRDTSFEQMIIRQTNGQGVDIVLNSLAEEKLQASVRCLAPGGRFLEIGKFDLASNNPLGMECFSREISFHGIMLDNLFNAESAVKRNLRDIMSEGLKNGAIKPLTRTVFPKDQLEAAFRFMAAGKHIGKVIIKIQDEKKPSNELVPALPHYHCAADRSYIVFGGLGGFGLELADWLVMRGCRNLVITSRVGIANGYQKMRVELWQSYGAKVVIVSGKDASELKDCEFIIKTAVKLAPVDAIFNLAVVLKDAIWDNQTPESFGESFKAKAWATKNMDVLTRKLCPKLRKFVVFSSVSCGRGNAGQTNYGMSNSVMERICEKRAAEGLPSLAIQWGAIGDVGLVADMQEDNKELVIGGTLQQKISSCLHELDGFLCQDAPIVSSMVVAEKRAGGGTSDSIVNTVLNIMGLKDLKLVSATSSLTELGMDSMMAVEIKQTLEREYEISLTAQDIRILNFSKLQELDSKKSETKTWSGDSSDDSEKTVPGVQLLMKVIGCEISTEPCIKLQTKETSAESEVYILPGIEGFATVFSELMAKLKVAAYCFQYGLDSNQDSIFSIAETISLNLPEQSKESKNFHVVGYSFGSIPAIELVRKLEKKGKSGKLTLIDGSPELMKSIREQRFISNTEEELQNTLLLGMTEMSMPSQVMEFAVLLGKCRTWEDKVECFVSFTADSNKTINASHDVKKKFFTSLYQRLVAVWRYDASDLPLLKTPVTLLKPTNPTVRNVSDDFGLSKLTSGKINIFTLEGDHSTILDNDKVAMAINEEPFD